MNITQTLSAEFGMRETYAENIITLLDEGCTIPFISRYRKEMHGSQDDQTIRNFADRLTYLRNFDKKKADVIKLITEQEKMTPEILAAIQKAVTLTELDDIYRPFRPKRQTRATMAVAKGLQPLADAICLQKENKTLQELASAFINEEKGVKTADEALQGASDIIAESISDDAELRKVLRKFMEESAIMQTTLKEKTNEKSPIYETYARFQEAIKTLPSHRILAINRGEKDDCLKVTVNVNEEKMLQNITDFVGHKTKVVGGKYDEFFKNAIEDSYARLIFPSLEREQRNALTDSASEQAIKMFEVNLRPLLLQPPLKNKTILGLDPAYRTGCKIAVIDASGNVVDTTVIYPTPPHNKVAEANQIIGKLIEKDKVDAISIGNGTASKESEIFVANLIKITPRPVQYAVVNEAGASVYSASKLGAEEFPEFDVALRSAVSIARRLQDPLAELIKIDVKSIGVGQYQHDMPQKRLTEVLDGVVESCVNSVGVDLNTASYKLLERVSGLNSGIAKSIVEYRKENGQFTDRNQLKKVKKLGDKAFEQCAGFLRIQNGKNILDNTAVHPESYAAVRALLAMFDMQESDIATQKLALLPKAIEEKGIKKVADELGIGQPTLLDIVAELLRPGRDIRDELPAPELRSDVMGMEDLKEGMVLKGVVRNVIDFGAFVDIGVHQDGLVHISQICDRYIKHPSEELTVGQPVEVQVLSVDLAKKRIALTMRIKK